jgi:aspartate aminotransferase
MLDAISKSLAATGLRVGWSVAAPAVTQRMSDLLGHVCAWAPKAEQMATARFLDDAEAFRAFRLEMHRRLGDRLGLLHRRFTALQQRGFPVEPIPPEGTLYLSARIDLRGRMAGGKRL